MPAAPESRSACHEPADHDGASPSGGDDFLLLSLSSIKAGKLRWPAVRPALKHCWTVVVLDSYYSDDVIRLATTSAAPTRNTLCVRRIAAPT